MTTLNNSKSASPPFLQSFGLVEAERSGVGVAAGLAARNARCKAPCAEHSPTSADASADARARGAEGEGAAPQALNCRNSVLGDLCLEFWHRSFFRTRSRNVENPGLSRQHLTQPYFDLTVGPWSSIPHQRNRSIRPGQTVRNPHMWPVLILVEGTRNNGPQGCKICKSMRPFAHAQCLLRQA